VKRVRETVSSDCPSHEAGIGPEAIENVGAMSTREGQIQ
jgi:hypothetical protein